MKQAMLAICLLWATGFQAPVNKPTPAESRQTIAWLTQLQKGSGGFAADARPATAPSLPATISAVRALNYFGGSAPRATDILRFLRSCWNEQEGGFAPTPGGQPDVRTTAVALLGLVDLKAAEQNQDMIRRSMAYLGMHVKNYEDVRIAAAAFETNHLAIPELTHWREILHAMPFSAKAEQARETGGVTVARMRLGDTIDNREAVLEALRAAQQPEGAWSKAGSPPDLDSSYRIMRAFFMLKAAPRDPDALRKFIARCRQTDGSYAVAPGQPGSISGTYYAGVILHWLDRLEEPRKPL
jgi:hypothetical protein